MEDSPLSITASVTGILTFIAAIVAFIYVRYQRVIHGEEEIVTITNSVTSGIEETVKMVYPKPSSAGLGQTELMAAFAKSLYAVELDILIRIRNVQDNLHIEPDAPQPFRVAEPFELDTTINDNFEFSPKDRIHRDLFRKIQALSSQHQNQAQPERSASLTTRLFQSYMSLSMMSMASPSTHFIFKRLLPFLAAVLRLLIGTPMLWRWYRERDKVMKLIQKRDKLQSQHIIFSLQALST
ncbi:hypothetical protein F4680DRAFT_38033 [Xylaria scruposa]|nr:hypothetical protein F4680DRAFT_38033 [Xylaria scruposa]